MLQIQQKELNNVVVLELVGRITIGRDCQELEWKVDELSKAGKKIIVVDLAKVTFIDSTGLGIFAMCSGKLKSVGGELRLAAPSQPVEQVFKLTKVDSILSIHATTAAAVAAVPSSSASA
jgi:anti-sigma B factor antagonist